MGRARLPIGTRYKDKISTVIIKLPKEIYEKIEKKGVPSKIILELVIKTYK